MPRYGTKIPVLFLLQNVFKILFYHQCLCKYSVYLFEIYAAFLDGFVLQNVLFNILYNILDGIVIFASVQYKYQPIPSFMEHKIS